jgi:G8 domain
MLHRMTRFLGGWTARKLAAGVAVIALAGTATYAVVDSRASDRRAPSHATAAPSSAPATTAPPADAKPGTATSRRSGAWSDAATWGGRVPGAKDLVVVSSGTTVTYDQQTAAVAGVRIAARGTLEFDPGRATTLESSRNVTVEGTLRMRPASPSVTQVLRFVGIDERRFAGGGMDPIASDVGLWVTGAGKLDLVGSAKTGWTRLAGGIDAGASAITLQQAPSGWQPGDELSIAPTSKPISNDHRDPAFNDFDERGVKAVAGAEVTLNAPVAHEHPQVNGSWTAEVMNLTRNVRVEGTARGHSHVFIHSTTPQTINYVGIRYMGPRKDTDHDGYSDFVAGRYGLHFHLNGDHNRGVVVQGVVVRDTPSHAFVAHNSNGITFRDDISYNTTEDAYWWDQNPAPGGDVPPEPLDFYETSDVLYDHDIAAKLYAIPDFRGYNQAGFNLSSGSNNTIVDSAVVGNLGGTSAAGFAWPEGANGQPNAWNFRDNIAHNNSEDGILVWQNTDYGPHLTDDFVAYRNGHCGIKHGAYVNSYLYRHPILFENATCGILASAQASPTVAPTTFDHPTIVGGQNAVLSTEHVGDPVEHTVAFRDCTISGQSGAKVEVDTENDPQMLDFIRCGIEPKDVHVTKMVPGDRIRSQRANGSAFQVGDDGKVSTIGRFDSQAPWRAPGENKPPVISMATPRGDARFNFSGDTDASFSVNARDPDGRIARVLFFVEGRLVGGTTSAPYRISANLRPEMNGVTLVSAVAIDDQGLPTFSKGVRVFINQPAVPETASGHQHP